MTKTWRIPVHIVFYREEGEWVAHCLEFDICGNGQTKPEAFASLSQAVHIQLEQSMQHNNTANLFSPADGRYFQMFAAGKNITAGELEMHFEQVDSIIMDEPEAREYSDDDFVMV